MSRFGSVTESSAASVLNYAFWNYLLAAEAARRKCQDHQRKVSGWAHASALSNLWGRRGSDGAGGRPWTSGCPVWPLSMEILQSRDACCTPSGSQVTCESAELIKCDTTGISAFIKTLLRQITDRLRKKKEEMWEVLPSNPRKHHRTTSSLTRLLSAVMHVITTLKYRISKSCSFLQNTAHSAHLQSAH